MVIGRRGRAVVVLLGAVAAALGSAASWRVRTIVLVAPITDGEPVTTSVAYHPQWLLATLVLAAAAGVLGFVGAGMLRGGSRPRRDGPGYDDSHNELIP